MEIKVNSELKYLVDSIDGKESIPDEEVYIQDNQPQDGKIWIKTGEISNLGTEVVNSLEGNQTDKAPSVNILKTTLGSAAYTNTTRLTDRGHCGWEGQEISDKKVPNISLIAYWNGAHDDANHSNLEYVRLGKLGEACTKQITDATNVISTNWVNHDTSALSVPTMAFMSLWDGSYSDETHESNLLYCKKGAFGSIITKSADDYLPKIRYTFTKTPYCAAAETWYDLDITGSNLSDGTYIMQLYTEDYTANKQYWERCSGVLAWYSGTTNSGIAHEVYLSKAGHASNNHNIRIRTLRQVNPGKLKLQICDSIAWDKAGTVTLTFVKII